MFEISGLWFHVFAIFPLALLSRLSALSAKFLFTITSFLETAFEFGTSSLRYLDAVTNANNNKKKEKRKKFGANAIGGRKRNAYEEDEDREKNEFSIDPGKLPERFKHTCKGDQKLQVQKYERHLMYKNEVRYETLLCRECPNYDAVKENYGHAFHGVTREGHVVQLERPSGWQKLIESMKKRGFEEDPTVPVKEHIAFVTTYAFKNFDARPWPDGKITRIVDVSQFSAGELNFEVLNFLRHMAKFGSAFLCERHGKVYLCNPSPTFRFVYALVAPLASTKTLDNVFILDTFDEMRAKISEEIDLKYVPKEFGGDCECEGGCWKGQPMQMKLDEFARALNNGTQQQPEAEEAGKLIVETAAQQATVMMPKTPNGVKA